MSNQQNFSRKEVRALLKKQIKASAHSYGTMEICHALGRNGFYLEEIDKSAKRLKNVNVIKF